MRFISAGIEQFTRKTTPPAPYIRKAFKLAFMPKRARIRIATNGFYRLFINGTEITKCVLAPYVSNPEHLCYYDEYEIASNLQKGKNAIGILLGNGHANPFWHAIGFQNSCTVGTPVKTAIELTASDGVETFSLESDGSFKTHPSAMVQDIYRYGVHYDARLEIDGWNLPDFDDSGWKPVFEVDAPNGELRLCKAEPIILREERKPEKIELQEDFYYLHTSLVEHAAPVFGTHVSAGYLYDFGINTAGLVRLKIKGKRGQKITMRFGEKLYKGKFNLNSVYTLKAGVEDYADILHTDTYILKGEEEEIYVPFFTYHGFRYVLVEGIEPEQATEELLTYLVMNSDVPRRTEFQCSDETFNTLYRMGINSDLSNFWFFPTDCPHREKSGWTNDMSMSAEQFLLNLDCANSLSVWMDGYLAEQREDGTLTAIIPTAGDFARNYNGVLSDSNLVNIPYYCYKYDGRIDIFRQTEKAIEKYLAYSMSVRDSRGLVANSLNDWAQPGRDIGIESDCALVDSALLIDMAQKCVQMFHALADEVWAEKCARFAEELRTAIRTHLIDFRSMGTVDGAQTSQALALSMGIFNEKEYPAAYQELVTRIAKKDNHVYCGMVGLRYIFHVLCDNGDADLAHTMIVRPDAPSYGNMILRGATALCECLEDNRFNMSENHHFFGDILNLFITNYAGLHINPNGNDIREVLIKPAFTSKLQWAEASYTMKWGTVSVRWEQAEEGYDVSVFVPEGARGTICVKDGLKELTTGHSQWHISL